MKRCSTAAGVWPACRAFSMNRWKRSAVSVAFSRIVHSDFAIGFLSAGAENRVGGLEDLAGAGLGDRLAAAVPMLDVSAAVFESEQAEGRATEHRGSLSL